jgi:hypothetical protein
MVASEQPNTPPDKGLPQNGPVISLGCGHTFAPNFQSGERLVTCLECEDQPQFAVNAKTPVHIEYRVRRFRG